MVVYSAQKSSSLRKKLVKIAALPLPFSDPKWIHQLVYLVEKETIKRDLEYSIPTSIHSNLCRWWGRKTGQLSESYPGRPINVLTPEIVNNFTQRPSHWSTSPCQWLQRLFHRPESFMSLVFWDTGGNYTMDSRLSQNGTNNQMHVLSPIHSTSQERSNVGY